jgi:hypothetical protein
MRGKYMVDIGTWNRLHDELRALESERDAALAENKRLISRITDKAIRDRRIT